MKHILIILFALVFFSVAKGEDNWPNWSKRPIWGSNLKITRLTEHLPGDMAHLRKMLRQILEERDGDKMGIIMKLISDSPEFNDSMLKEFIADLNNTELEITVPLTEEEYKAGASAYSQTMIEFSYACGLLLLIESHYTPEGEAAILRMIKHPESQMKLSAAVCLGRSGSEKVLQPLKDLAESMKYKGSDAKDYSDVVATLEERLAAQPKPKTEAEPLPDTSKDSLPAAKEAVVPSVSSAPPDPALVPWIKFTLAALGLILLTCTILRQLILRGKQ